jgi:5-methylcytosine-specific restriction protein B
MPEHDPSNISRQSVLKALKLLNRGHRPKGYGKSVKYDLVYDERNYPPKAVLAKAFEIETGGLDLPNEFTGGSETKCFDILKELKFSIIEKPNQESAWENICRELYAFTTDHSKAKQDKSRFSEMHERLQEIGSKIQQIIDSAGFYSINVKTSIGQGEYADVPWIGFFDHRITNGASKGHYPVILFESLLGYFYVSYAISNGEKKNNPESFSSLKTKLSGMIKPTANLSNDPIALNSLTSTAKGYEQGVVAAKKYTLPIDDPITLSKSIYETLSLHSDLASKLAPETNQGLNLNSMNTTTRLITSLASKPFVILAGGTGTGKTKCAIEVARKVCRKQPIGEAADYEVVAVGADWTDTRPLLGYENILGAIPTYTVPKALDLIIRASRNKERPHFLILDEMNLSHVERYFSDFLSLMEAKKIDVEASKIKLHSNENGMPSTDGNVEGNVEHRISWPENLFVIGTVNIDETTHMFSPKVLDRAHVIEFKPDEHDVAQGLVDKWSVTIESDAAKKDKDDKHAGSWSEALTPILCGEQKANEIRKHIASLDPTTRDQIKDRIMGAWKCLQGSRFSFSHRTAQEAADYIFVSHMVCLKHKDMLEFEPTWDKLTDLAFLQKVLPKINGSAETLSVKADIKDPKTPAKETTLLDILMSEFRKDAELTLCIQKLEEMKATLEKEHFVSFIQ